MSHRFEEAAESYKKAIELDPLNPGNYSNLLDALRSKSQMEQALEFLTKLGEQNARAGECRDQIL